MTDSFTQTLNAPRLLFDLQQANQLAQSIYGCLEAKAIATRITQGLVEQFNCALARIWLVEPERTHLKLMASAGLHTRTNGEFARVPMGAFKVGKIAQNRVSFLSNNLPNEPWVKDRDWAIRNQIQGFAGYPLATADQVVGVLAVFRCDPLEPEFLEVLLSLCSTVTVALGCALEFQARQHPAGVQTPVAQTLPSVLLSDQLARLLKAVPLRLVGTERALPFSVHYLFLQLAELIQRLGCMTCGLTYDSESVVLSAIVPAPDVMEEPPDSGDELKAKSLETNILETEFSPLLFASACLGGALETVLDRPHKVLQIRLKLPYQGVTADRPIRVQCQSALLQGAFTQMVATAGLRLWATPDRTVPLITDQVSWVQESQLVLWVQTQTQQAVLPQGIKAVLNLAVTPGQLREAVETVMQGELWNIAADAPTQKMLSTREQEVMGLLVKGLRDRDIAGELYISESTVKFHINNTLTKLKVKTRVQAVYELMRHGWLEEGQQA